MWFGETRFAWCNANKALQHGRLLDNGLIRSGRPRDRLSHKPCLCQAQRTSNVHRQPAPRTNRYITTTPPHHPHIFVNAAVWKSALVTGDQFPEDIEQIFHLASTRGPMYILGMNWLILLCSSANRGWYHPGQSNDVTTISEDGLLGMVLWKLVWPGVRYEF